MAIPTIAPGASGLAPEFLEDAVTVLISVDEGTAVPSDVDDVDSVIGVPLAVEMGSELDDVVIDGRPVTMVVCLVIVTMELFGIV
jgi:hypothetical protein